MAHNIRVDDDFTLEVLEDEEARENGNQGYQFETEPHWGVKNIEFALLSIKEIKQECDIDIEDNYLAVDNKICNFLQIKTELESDVEEEEDLILEDEPFTSVHVPYALSASDNICHNSVSEYTSPPSPQDSSLSDGTAKPSTVVKAPKTPAPFVREACLTPCGQQEKPSSSGKEAVKTVWLKAFCGEKKISRIETPTKSSKTICSVPSDEGKNDPQEKMSEGVPSSVVGNENNTSECVGMECAPSVPEISSVDTEVINNNSTSESLIKVSQYVPSSIDENINENRTSECVVPNHNSSTTASNEKLDHPSGDLLHISSNSNFSMDVVETVSNSKLDAKIKSSIENSTSDGSNEIKDCSDVKGTALGNKNFPEKTNNISQSVVRCQNSKTNSTTEKLGNPQQSSYGLSKSTNKGSNSAPTSSEKVGFKKSQKSEPPKFPESVVPNHNSLATAANEKLNNLNGDLLHSSTKPKSSMDVVETFVSNSGTEVKYSLENSTSGGSNEVKDCAVVKKTSLGNKNPPEKMSNSSQSVVRYQNSKIKFINGKLGNPHKSSHGLSKSTNKGSNFVPTASDKLSFKKPQTSEPPKFPKNRRQWFRSSRTNRDDSLMPPSFAETENQYPDRSRRRGRLKPYVGSRFVTSRHETNTTFSYDFPNTLPFETMNSKYAVPNMKYHSQRYEANDSRFWPNRYVNNEAVPYKFTNRSSSERLNFRRFASNMEPYSESYQTNNSRFWTRRCESDATVSYQFQNRSQFETSNAQQIASNRASYATILRALNQLLNQQNYQNPANNLRFNNEVSSFTPLQNQYGTLSYRKRHTRSKRLRVHNNPSQVFSEPYRSHRPQVWDNASDTNLFVSNEFSNRQRLEFGNARQDQSSGQLYSSILCAVNQLNATSHQNFTSYSNNVKLEMSFLNVNYQSY